MHKILLTFLVLFFIQANAFGQSDWKLNEEKDGIEIYTSSVPDSKVKAIKVECVIKATESQLVALLMDINSSANWIYHTKTAKVIKQVSASELYYYSEVSLPWPAANRDFVAHLTVSQNPVTKVVVIDGPAVPNMVPLKKGIVRINNSKGKWTITPKGFDELKIEYTLHTDPAGSLPAWMVNMFATEGPLKVFENLKVQMQKPDYKNAALPFIDNKQYALNAAY
ncbi:START domain-containing protein [Mucilaginibacter sp.]|uniref:START domain-containing protein n=1 Tax=Mucilaginibacter sp. TaxID=1882438 RepID=UPI00284F271B|nr:START domain-containing protein [Mucilaginibacter sp.]MDR3697835.1 START domain-containing protein [Mucilaginibacter sp.]